MELWQQGCLSWNLSSIDGRRVTLGKLLPTDCPPASAGIASGCPNLWMLKSHAEDGVLFPFDLCTPSHVS